MTLTKISDEVVEETKTITIVNNIPRIKYLRERLLKKVAEYDLILAKANK